MANKTDTVSADEHLAALDEIEKLKAQLATVQTAAVKPVSIEDDLETFKDGEFTKRGTGDTFKLKVVDDDPHGKRFHLKNKEKSFFGATTSELREHFDGDFAKWEPKPEAKK